MKGFRAIFMQSCAEIARRPVCWIGFFVLPLMLTFMLTNLMEVGLPTRIPAAIVDMDHTSTSRKLTQTLNGMQMVHITKATESYTEARHDMQRGEVYGYFLIPRDFEQDLLSGRRPVITFYTNTAYYVPANLLYKTFKLTATYSKAGVISSVLSNTGMSDEEIAGMLSPVTVVTRPIGNPQLNYSIYLTNSFLPAVFQLMIMMMTCYLICDDIKYGFSRYYLARAGGSIFRLLAAKLLPSLIIWLVEIMFMYSMLFFWCGYPMNGSHTWMILSEVLFVLASMGMGLLFACIIPNMRLALSNCALVGILSFSLAAFSFPVESMYGAVGIFSYILPTRYNFLIYIDQALNGIDIYYSRWWFVAYIIFIVLPLPFLPRLRRAMARPVYAP
ncbi:MAG: ABC transporter permease [Lepagella sp.]